MKLTGIILTDLTNEYYQTMNLDSLPKIMERLQGSINDEMLLGELLVDGYQSSPIISLSNVSHQITNLKLEENKLIADIEVLDTPQGRILKDLINNKFDYKPVIRGLQGSHRLVEICTWDIQVKPNSNK